eukprot:6517358-Prymnesium_polylepis.2
MTHAGPAVGTSDRSSYANAHRTRLVGGSWHVCSPEPPQTRPGLPLAAPPSQVPPPRVFVYGVDNLAPGHHQVDPPVVAF